jgi:uncharacterized protein (DUF58 family)
MAAENQITGVVLTARNMLLGMLAVAGLGFLLVATSPAQAAYAAFFCAVLVLEYKLSRNQLEGLRIKRTHVPRAFEGDRVAVELALSTTRPFPLQLLQIEDQFLASLDIRRRDLVPWLVANWEVRLPYTRHAERHHGLYLIGPVRVHCADPLGIFQESGEVGTITPLTVYPRADPLPDYRVPGVQAQPGASVDRVARVGQGEEILAVREYRRGDPPGRIHWRTSARRGKLHTLQLDQPIQTELAVLLDMTRPGRYGLGSEATPRLGVTGAVAILTRGHEARHRLSLGVVQRELTSYPPGSGLAHLHLLLDRLVLLESAGEGDFWNLALARARLLPPGGRAVFIVTTARTPIGIAEALQPIMHAGVSVDCVLIDERAFIKIYHDQDVVVPTRDEVESKVLHLRQAGARVFLLSRERQQLESEVQAQEMAQAMLRFHNGVRQ